MKPIQPKLLSKPTQKGVICMTIYVTRIDEANTAEALVEANTAEALVSKGRQNNIQLVDRELFL